MDLEHLNKSQIVLLTLLVSFVTSVATGIVTVTMLEEAPPIIAQTVNRVVERTVERVVPSGQTATVNTVTEKTIIVKESDLIAQAVTKVNASIVRLYTLGKDAEGNDADVFLGLGIVFKDDGTILTDKAALPVGVIYVARADGKRATATVVSNDDVTGLALLQGATSTETGEPLGWSAAKVVGAAPTLGKAVVSVSGKNSTRIGDGIVTALSAEKGEGATHIVETNIPVGAIVFGSPLINSDGELEGLSTAVSRAQADNSFLASEAIIMYTSPTHVDEAPTQ